MEFLLWLGIPSLGRMKRKRIMDQTIHLLQKYGLRKTPGRNPLPDHSFLAALPLLIIWTYESCDFHVFIYVFAL